MNGSSPATTMSQPCLCELTRGCFFCVERWPRPLTLCFFLFTLLFDSLKVWKKRWLKVSLSVHKVRGSFLFKLFYLVLGYSHLTYMQSTSWETLSWKKHKLESRLLGEISITSDMQMTPPQKPLDESESGEWKSWLKAQHSENEDHGVWSHHFMGNRWGNSVRLYFLGLQNHDRWWLQTWN